MVELRERSFVVPRMELRARSFVVPFPLPSPFVKIRVYSWSIPMQQMNISAFPFPNLGVLCVLCANPSPARKSSIPNLPKNPKAKAIKHNANAPVGEDKGTGQLFPPPRLAPTQLPTHHLRIQPGRRARLSLARSPHSPAHTCPFIYCSNGSRAVSASREPQAAERWKHLRILHTCADRPLFRTRDREQNSAQPNQVPAITNRPSSGAIARKTTGNPSATDHHKRLAHSPLSASSPGGISASKAISRFN